MGISFFARANILFGYIKIPGGLNWAQIITCVPLSLSSIFKWTLLAYRSPLRPDTHCRKLLVTGLLSRRALLLCKINGPNSRSCPHVKHKLRILERCATQFAGQKDFVDMMRLAFINPDLQIAIIKGWVAISRALAGLAPTRHSATTTLIVSQNQN